MAKRMSYNVSTKTTLIEDFTFTDEEIAAQLESQRTSAIEQITLECASRITSGFESTCLGETQTFDSTDNDQTNIQGLAITAILGLQGLTTEETHWKASGETRCYNFEYAQILQLSTDLKAHLDTTIDKKNEYREYITAAETADEISTLLAEYLE